MDAEGYIVKHSTKGVSFSLGEMRKSLS